MHRFIVPAHHVIEKIVLYYELRLNSHQIIIMSISERRNRLYLKPISN